MADDTNKFDELGFIMDWEDGKLPEDKVIEGFQQLIDSGTIRSLQGSYGRMAARLQQEGLIHGF
jgi:hypothetical protein